MVKIWEDMELAYIRDGLVSLQEIKKQRLSVTDNLNNCQRSFIEFLERPCSKQEKVLEFISSFNQFSLEYPDLRSDEQTKEELMNRLERLSNSLWDVTNERKEEALAKINDMSAHGWSYLEMKQVVRNMATLSEIEIKKFSAVYNLVMRSEPPVELDAEIFAKRLLERGVLPFDAESGTSPALDQVFGNLMTKAHELLYKNPAVNHVLHEEPGIILRKEHAIFTYRLAAIHSWALCTLEEIARNASIVYEHLDDWIVTAVEQETFITQEAVDFIKSAIQSELLQIDEFQATLAQPELFSKLQTLVFRNDETMLYMKNVVEPHADQVEETRFNLEQLNNMYLECRYNAGDLGHSCLIDSMSFNSMLVKAVRQGAIPLNWKYRDFNKLAAIARKFETLPL